MNTSYHNTTNLDGEALYRAEFNSITQEDVVLSIFTNQDDMMSASQVHRAFNDANVPLTSIRRAISNLKATGQLLKTDLKQTGIYGKPEYLYLKI
jgi:hypothetical protein